MAWTDIFPVLTDDHVEDFRHHATRAEKAELETWFGVRRIFPAHDAPPPGKHLVSATLFWKNIGVRDPDLPRPTRFRMIHARRLGLVKRFDAWESYVEPFLLFSKRAREKNPDLSLRVYLAADLDFLVEDLTRAGWEVHLMKSSSIRYCPGGFWRFLALGERGRYVTMIDADRVSHINSEVERTRLMEASGLGLWRVPGYYNADFQKQVRYRPILGGHFGAKSGLPVKTLIQAYVWHLLRGTLPTMVEVPGCGPKPLQFLEWPGYGLDEVFQLMALYPRLVRHGTLTFVPTDARSLFLPIDIEYATWANVRSEVVYSRSATANCC